MGIADPAHYLHSRYFLRALDTFVSRPRRILDAGCGAGDYSIYLARRFPDAQVLGVDIDPERVERNRTNARRLEISNAQFEVADLTVADFADPFDLIVAIDVLEHIESQDGALSRLHSALRSGGIAFVHMPTVRSTPVPLSRFLPGFHRWAETEHVAVPRTAEEVVAAMVTTGFEVLTHHRTFGRFTGELATSLFALPYANSTGNRLLQGLLAPVCRVLAIGDIAAIDSPRYAVAITARRTNGATQ
jgi:2-polyprenyl-3-methyl-5-hydroxy-6-metoxy-1,4-benzoquinol methylase